MFQLIKRIFNLVPGLKQLRLSSIDCAEIQDDFWSLLSDKRLMPHFHLSLQSGNNLILKRMKRRHSREQAIDFCNKVRRIRNDVVFGADLIAGFPTETDKMFEDSIALIDHCDLTHLHVFPYSPRDLTPASKMPQLSKKVIKERANKLRTYGEKKFLMYLKEQVGKKTTMLVEKNDYSGSFGKNQYFTKLYIEKKLPIGSIVNCEIYKVKEKLLQAKLI